MPIGIVTDSTSYLPPALASSLGIEIVDVHVVIDGVTYKERDISVNEVLEAMRRGKPVTTSRPNPEAFSQAYRRLIDRGCDRIVSVHMSSAISGTYDSAKLAAQELSGQVNIEVVDSKGVGAMCGFAVLDAASTSTHEKDSFAQFVRQIESQCANSTIELYVDTLEFLQRGGRISKTQSRVGNALSVKPLLHMVDGKISQHQLLRTSPKALDRLVEITVFRAKRVHSDAGGFQIAVHHVDAQERAHLVAQQLCEKLNIPSVQVTPVGAVIAAHVGPGAVAVVVSPTLT